jgi:hypothetical protein
VSFRRMIPAALISGLTFMTAAAGYLGNDEAPDFSAAVKIARQGSPSQSQTHSGAPSTSATGSLRRAQILACVGYCTVAAARSTRRLGELAAEAGVIPITVDVVDENTVARAVEYVESEIGPIDLLVNNDGIAGHSGVPWGYEPSEWWDVVDVSLRGTFPCAHAVCEA